MGRARHRLAAALLPVLLALVSPARAHATDKLLVAFHMDFNFNIFIMHDDRAFGRDVQIGPMRYHDPYLNVMFTGGLQFRPHPIVAIDVMSGYSWWTGRAWDTSRMDITCWIPDETAFRVKNHFLPVELAVMVSVVEAPRVFLALSAGPGFYKVWRRTRGKGGVEQSSEGMGGGGKFSLIFGTKSTGAFEFNLEIGFRLMRIKMNEVEDGVDAGDFRPDFSGPYLGFRLLFGGGSADPAAAPEPQPQYAPAPAPAPSPQPVPPSGAPPG